MTTADLTELLASPDAIFLNLLRGTIARPSPDQIVHLYGAEVLRAALPSPPAPDSRVTALEEEVTRLTALLEGRFADLQLVSLENGDLTLSSPLIPLLAEAMVQMLRPSGTGEPANYTETELSHEDLGLLTLTLQRRSGKTPHALRREAENRADQAERRERALLASNQEERETLLKLTSLQDRVRAAARLAGTDPERALEQLRGLSREGLYR